MVVIAAKSITLSGGADNRIAGLSLAESGVGVKWKWALLNKSPFRPEGGRSGMIRGGFHLQKSRYRTNITRAAVTRSKKRATK
jgi:hypothetical protein